MARAHHRIRARDPNSRISDRRISDSLSRRLNCLGRWGARSVAAKTPAGQLPAAITAQVSAARRTALLHLFDAAGEFSTDREDNSELMFLDHAQGLVFVDPFSIPWVRDQLGELGPLAAERDFAQVRYFMVASVRGALASGPMSPANPFGWLMARAGLRLLPGQLDPTGLNHTGFDPTGQPEQAA